MKKPFLSVIVLARNQASELPLTLIEIDRYLSEQDYSSEILIVDGASTDNTKDVGKKFSLLIKNARYVNSGAMERGKGISKGLIEARGEWRIYLDADQNRSISEFDKMIPYIKKNYQIVTGIRENLSLVEKLKRLIVSGWYRLILFKERIKDPDCGFTCLNEDLVEKIVIEDKISGFLAGVEILAAAQKLNYKIKEVPVVLSNLGKIHDNSSVSFVDYWRVMCQTLKIRKRLIGNGSR